MAGVLAGMWADWEEAGEGGMGKGEGEEGYGTYEGESDYGFESCCHIGPGGGFGRGWVDGRDGGVRRLLLIWWTYGC